MVTLLESFLNHGIQISLRFEVCAFSWSHLFLLISRIKCYNTDKSLFWADEITQHFTVCLEVEIEHRSDKDCNLLLVSTKRLFMNKTTLFSLNHDIQFNCQKMTWGQGNFLNIISLFLYYFSESFLSKFWGGRKLNFVKFFCMCNYKYFNV